MKRLLGRIWGGGLKTGLIAGLVALLVSATTVVAASEFLKKEKYRAKEGIFASFKDEEVSIPAAETTIASLPLDEGKYAIQAKLYVHDITAGSVGVNCQLSAGGDFDTGRVNTGAGRRTAVPLQVVHEFTAPGDVTLACGDDLSAGSASTKARFIRITAVRARKLVNAPSP